MCLFLIIAIQAQTPRTATGWRRLMSLKRIGFPKPTPSLKVKIETRLMALSKARAFRAIVWARDKGTCQFCGRRVRRSIDMHPLRGEVHHIRGRRVAPKDRYNPDTAVLLCLAHHQEAQRHEIVVARRGDHS